MAFLHLSLGRQKARLGTFSVLAGWATSSSSQPRPKLPPKLPLFYPRPFHGFAGSFNGFKAACQVMSGSCVGLSSSFFRASESDVRHFFGGWFWQVGPPLELESCWGLAVSHACRTVPLGAFKFKPTEAEAAIPWPSTAWFSLVFLRFRSCLSGDVTSSCVTFSTDGLGRLGFHASCWGLAASVFHLPLFIHAEDKGQNKILQMRRL